MSKILTGFHAVTDLSLDIKDGEFLVLVGPSGCGKTTTMKMVNRLIDPSSGRVLLDGEDVATVDPVQLRRRVGYVIQQVGLFPHQTVRANVATVPSLLGWDRKRARTRVLELLELVGLDPSVYADRYPSQLSGGQRQRVGVARALAADPLVLLMDEPFSAVDPVVREQLQNEFLRLQGELGKTIRAIDEEIVNVFASAFADVSQNFTDLFGTLFLNTHWLTDVLGGILASRVLARAADGTGEPRSAVGDGRRAGVEHGGVPVARLVPVGQNAAGARPADAVRAALRAPERSRNAPDSASRRE